MRKLLEATHDAETDSLYLYYSRAAVKRQISLNDDHSVNVDFSRHDKVVGIELLKPGNADLARLVRFADEYGLSLQGLFELV